MSLNTIICGADGRMGKTLQALARDCGASVVGLFELDRPRPPSIWMQADVIIDFSYHSAINILLGEAVMHNTPTVIGTTGHTEEELERIREASRSIPITLAGNYSIGVNLLLHLTRMAARTLPEAYVPEILEMHHKHKKDAPSGTAINLAEAVEAARGFSKDTRIDGRSGDTGERPDRQIGMHAVRGGEIVGEHTVFFIGDSDRIELTHRASDRGIFARGAYQAAHWLVKQKPGLYSMQDVLGLRD